MGEFKSGIILKDRVVLTPIYNESITDLLKSKRIDGIASDVRNCSVDNGSILVMAELIPTDDDIFSDVDGWTYKIVQDDVPDWYKKNPKEYENRFRGSVKGWRDKNIFNICGVPCTKLKEENGCVYYHVCTSLFSTVVGGNNDYRASLLREKLLNCSFAESLLKKYGDRLIPTSIDLTSMDGLKDYGKLDGDLLAIPDLNLYRECREHIFCGNERWWLSTPETTLSGGSFSASRIVNAGGDVDWKYCTVKGGVRPFFILKNGEEKLTSMSFF